MEIMGWRDDGVQTTWHLEDVREIRDTLWSHNTIPSVLKTKAYRMPIACSLS